MFASYSNCRTRKGIPKLGVIELFDLYTKKKILDVPLSCIRIKSNIVNSIQVKQTKLKGGKEVKMAYSILHVIVVCIINNTSGA